MTGEMKVYRDVGKVFGNERRYKLLKYIESNEGVKVMELAVLRRDEMNRKSKQEAREAWKSESVTYSLKHAQDLVSKDLGFLRKAKLVEVEILHKYRKYRLSEFCKKLFKISK